MLNTILFFVHKKRQSICFHAEAAIDWQLEPELFYIVEVYLGLSEHL